MSVYSVKHNLLVSREVYCSNTFRNQACGGRICILSRTLFWPFKTQFILQFNNPNQIKRGSWASQTAGEHSNHFLTDMKA